MFKKDQKKMRLVTRRFAVLFIASFVGSAGASVGVVGRGAVASDSTTSGAELREIVSLLSGATPIGIQQRFSDSPDIRSAAAWIQTQYSRAGIDAETIEYNPMDVLSQYARGTERTYRGYFQHMLPQFAAEYATLCEGTIDEKTKLAVEKRLERVGLSTERLCAAVASERVELYIRTAIDHTVGITRTFLGSRTLPTWPNVVAHVSGVRGDLHGDTQPNFQSSVESSLERPLCVVGAHFDSVAREGGGRGKIVSPQVIAPGADDNASGTAAVMVLARAVRDWLQSASVDAPCDFAFVHFSGEEEGLFGSLAYAHLQNQRRVLWMLNFDMIAFHPAHLDHAEQADHAGHAASDLFNIGYAAENGGSALAAVFAAGARGKLPSVSVERQDFLYSSDQITFMEMGVPALAISEQACSDSKCEESYKNFNPHLHTSDDAIGVLDFDYAAQIVHQSFQGLQALVTSPLPRL